jgi:hypothetical protein
MKDFTGNSEFQNSAIGTMGHVNILKRIFMALVLMTVTKQTVILNNFMIKWMLITCKIMDFGDRGNIVSDSIRCVGFVLMCVIQKPTL